MPKKPTKRYAVIASRTRDLFYGEVISSNAEIAKTQAADVVNVRHITYWKGPVGGLTGLAAEGPGAGSRIGAPSPKSLLTNIANVFEVTEAARAKFDAMAPSAS